VVRYLKKDAIFIINSNTNNTYYQYVIDYFIMSEIMSSNIHFYRGIIISLLDTGRNTFI